MEFNFGKKLREARLNTGLRSYEMAQKIGVANSTYSLYESGQREPDVGMIKRIAAALSISADSLLEISMDSDEAVDTLSPAALEVAAAYDSAPSGVQDGVRRFLGLPEIARRLKLKEAPPAQVYVAAREGGEVVEYLTPEQLDEMKKALDEATQRAKDID